MFVCVREREREREREIQHVIRTEPRMAFRFCTVTVAVFVLAERVLPVRRKPLRSPSPTRMSSSSDLDLGSEGQFDIDS